MDLPSLFEQKSRTLALATTLVVAVVGGAALASASVGPASNADGSRVLDGPSDDDTVMTTSTPSATSTSVTTMEADGQASTDQPSTDHSTATQATAQPLQATATDTPTPTDSSPPTPSATATETATPTEPSTPSPSATASETATPPQPSPDTETETPAATPSDAPAAGMCYPYPTVGEPDEPIAFSATTDADDATYEWDFGTYQVGGSDVTASAGTATGQQVTNTFQEAGLYDVTLTVTTEDGRTDATTRQVAVMHQGTWYCTPPDE